jgi:16S rRNA (guanine(966)-N(2))-methyltransferase RsmD
LRKAFFDICREEVEGSRFLDLCAGTGAIGLEALSRGAAHAVFIEKDPLACRELRNNIRELKVEEKTTLLSMSMARAFVTLRNRQWNFPLIYIDPPYGQIDLNRTVADLLKSPSLLSMDGRLFIEESKKNAESLLFSNTLLIKERQYGDTLLFEYVQLYAETT